MVTCTRSVTLEFAEFVGGVVKTDGAGAALSAILTVFSRRWPVWRAVG